MYVGRKGLLEGPQRNKYVFCFFSCNRLFYISFLWTRSFRANFPQSIPFRLFVSLHAPPTHPVHSLAPLRLSYKVPRVHFAIDVPVSIFLYFYPVHSVCFRSLSTSFTLICKRTARPSMYCYSCWLLPLPWKKDKIKSVHKFRNMRLGGEKDGAEVKVVVQTRFLFLFLLLFRTQITFFGMFFFSLKSM